MPFIFGGSDLEGRIDCRLEYWQTRTSIKKSSGSCVVAASVAATHRGLPDSGVIKLAVSDSRILLTEDKDFGDWVFAHGSAVSGVILLRYDHLQRTEICQSLAAVLDKHAAYLTKRFTVITPTRVRVREL